MNIYYKTTENTKTNRKSTEVLVTCANCGNHIMLCDTSYTTSPLSTEVECEVLTKIASDSTKYCEQCGKRIDINNNKIREVFNAEMWQSLCKRK